MNRRKRWRRLRFEGLETRILLAADSFAPLGDPVTEVCVAAYCAEAADQTAVDCEVEAIATGQVLHVNISDAYRGSPEEIATNDLAFAELGVELMADQPLE